MYKGISDKQKFQQNKKTLYKHKNNKPRVFLKRYVSEFFKKYNKNEFESELIFYNNLNNTINLLKEKYCPLYKNQFVGEGVFELGKYKNINIRECEDIEYIKRYLFDCIANNNEKRIMIFLKCSKYGKRWTINWYMKEPIIDVSLYNDEKLYKIIEECKKQVNESHGETE